jgi:hypothetical protein
VKRRSYLRKQGKARVLENEVDVRVGDELAAAIHGVRIAGRSDARTVDDVPNEAEVDLGHHDAATGAALGHGDRHVGPRATLEVDASEIPVLRARAQELRAPREIDPAADPVRLQR